MSRWRDNFMTAIGNASISATPAPDAWYNSLDRPNFLLTWEILLVLGVAAAMYIRARRKSRRFKVKPGRRYN
jgi:hypothetical protein